jgi:hypothetical protein
LDEIKIKLWKNLDEIKIKSWKNLV